MATDRRILRCLRRGYVLVSFEPDTAMLDWHAGSPPGLPCPDRTIVTSPCFVRLRDAGLVALVRSRTDPDEAFWAITPAGLAACGGVVDAGRARRGADGEGTE